MATRRRKNQLLARVGKVTDKVKLTVPETVEVRSNYVDVSEVFPPTISRNTEKVAIKVVKKDSNGNITSKKSFTVPVKKLILSQKPNIARPDVKITRIDQTCHISVTQKETSSNVVAIYGRALNPGSSISQKFKKLGEITVGPGQTKDFRQTITAKVFQLRFITIVGGDVTTSFTDIITRESLVTSMRNCSITPLQFQNGVDVVCEKPVGSFANCFLYREKIMGLSSNTELIASFSSFPFTFRDTRVNESDVLEYYVVMQTDTGEIKNKIKSGPFIFTRKKTVDKLSVSLKSSKRKKDNVTHTFDVSVSSESTLDKILQEIESTAGSELYSDELSSVKNDINNFFAVEIVRHNTETGRSREVGVFSLGSISLSHKAFSNKPGNVYYSFELIKKPIASIVKNISDSLLSEIEVDDFGTILNTSTILPIDVIRRGKTGNFKHIKCGHPGREIVVNPRYVSKMRGNNIIKWSCQTGVEYIDYFKIYRKNREGITYVKNCHALGMTTFVVHDRVKNIGEYEYFVSYVTLDQSESQKIPVGKVTRRSIDA